MAKEKEEGKKAKISEAQQYMLLAVLGASLFLGAAISLVSNFVKQISFNTEVIMAEEASIKSYSDFIKTTGICLSPSGDVYSNEEIEKCDPDNIEISQIGGTLRANVLENMAANKALNSVPKEDNSSCLDSDGKRMTYKDLIQNYKNAKNTTELIAASQLIKSCSALRIIPDALPAFENEEALLASLNKIFLLSNWEPDSISPSGTIELEESESNLRGISVSLSVESGLDTTTKVLNNIERSIREFDIQQATIEWEDNNSLLFKARANAYYVAPSTVQESTVTIETGEEE